MQKVALRLHLRGIGCTVGVDGSSINYGVQDVEKLSGEFEYYDK